ncbi:ATP-binding cassette domain-containing protein [Streptomyces polyrhachis]|uniref:ATP-binding cassette domain-containing protein n=1 Tax=Streptomyces polyrhachis TaxID=1282885 RepID=A0ABW2GHH0_9ACTN
MIQAIGLTSRPTAHSLPAVDGLTFEAPAGRVTALLGDKGAGKTTALRLMLQREAGRGVTLFRGRPLSRIPLPGREVGVLLGDTEGHPARSIRDHLRMLAAAVGAPASRADVLLRRVGLDGLAADRLDALSLSMDRRLGLAVALLGAPHTLVLDDPVRDLSPREAAWFHTELRELAAEGVTVLTTLTEPRTAARFADRVLTLDAGRLLADQDAAEFTAARLRHRVIVRTPQASKLASYLTRTGSTPDSRVEVTGRDSGELAVHGAGAAAVGEIAHRHGILLHHLAEETDTALPAGLESRAAPPGPVRPTGPLTAPRAPAPAHALRYELRRTATGSRIPRLAAALAVAASLVLAALAATRPATGGDHALRLLAGWPTALPLPPAALAAGLIGACAFGQEYRYPALVPVLGAVPRRLGLLGAKLAVTAVLALLLVVVVLFADAAALLVLYGDIVDVPADGPAQLLAWAALTVGCGWTGLLAAGVFRSTAVGAAAVLTAPVAVAPALAALVGTEAGRRIVMGPLRLARTLHLPAGDPAGATELAASLAHSHGPAVGLSLAALLAVYTCGAVRLRRR